MEKTAKRRGRLRHNRRPGIPDHRYRFVEIIPHRLQVASAQTIKPSTTWADARPKTDRPAEATSRLSFLSRHTPHVAEVEVAKPGTGNRFHNRLGISKAGGSVFSEAQSASASSNIAIV
jgi:hypothetical protein